jgi:hypothetical protein
MQRSLVERAGVHVPPTVHTHYVICSCCPRAYMSTPAAVLCTYVRIYHRHGDAKHRLSVALTQRASAAQQRRDLMAARAEVARQAAAAAAAQQRLAAAQWDLQRAQLLLRARCTALELSTGVCGMRGCVAAGHHMAIIDTLALLLVACCLLLRPVCGAALQEQLLVLAVCMLRLRYRTVFKQPADCACVCTQMLILTLYLLLLLLGVA